jgi:hypothetical protein
MGVRALLVGLLLAATGFVYAQEPPPLPTGLGVKKDDRAEDAKAGEGRERTPDQQMLPEMPVGLGRVGEARDRDDPASAEPWAFMGFVEARVGSRLSDDPNQKDASIGEIRLQLSRDFETEHATFRIAADAVYDGVLDEHRVDLESGEGAIDLREANVLLRPLDAVDVKIGRQILTWGVGDLVFINDLFPKDFQAFFIGRDDEYLKAPSDAVRVSAFGDLANVELVYTPRFDPDRFVTGERLSYFNPALGRLAGRDAVIDAQERGDWFAQDELAARVYRSFGTFEAALYGYVGYWKTPEGQTPEGRPFHPRLSVVGGSLRGPLRGGLVTAEFGHYMSRDDENGKDPLIRNGETRVLLGYEREIGQELTGAVQYVGEILSDYGALRDSLPLEAERPDRVRHLVTLRLTKLLFNQNLTLSGFNFWSPNDKDGHLRLRASYKLTDDWLMEVGGNVFYGDEATVFGQLEDNTNVFFGVRRDF